MRTLLFMRHGKSSWADSSLPDHDRPLKDRGERDAPRMAKWLSEHHGVPDLIISSTALRAISTAKLFADACDYDQADIVEDGQLYHCDVPDFFDVLHRHARPDDETVMLVAHNPGMEAAVSTLARSHTRMTTAAIAVFSFDTDDWPRVQIDDAANFVKVARPKEL